MVGFQVGSSQRRPLQPPIETYTAMQDKAADSSTGAGERLRIRTFFAMVSIGMKTAKLDSSSANIRCSDNVALAGQYPVPMITRRSTKCTDF